MLLNLISLVPFWSVIATVCLLTEIDIIGAVTE
jgi:hypothetical protein